MAQQYIFTMQRLKKTVPPKRVILDGIWHSFFPGAKIGVIGLNGSGKSTLLRIMAGVDKDFDGEAAPDPSVKVGFLPQEPELDTALDVKGNVMIAVKDGFLPPKEMPGAKLAWLSIQSEDGTWHWADGRLDGSELIVSSKNVKKPVAVRYAYTNHPVGSLLP